MKNLSILLFLLIGTVVAYSFTQSYWCKKGEGDVVTTERQVDAFHSVSLEISAEVEIIQSEKHLVTVTTNNNLQEHISTEVENGVLEIETKDCNCINSSGIKLTVYTPVIDEIEVNGSGEIFANSTIMAEKISFNINGSGDINFKDLRADNYSVEVNGSGDVELSGKSSRTGEIEINGSGDVNTSNVPTSAMAISVAGSGTVEISPTAALDVDIAGSGDVIYHGKPTIQSSIVGSGDLIQKN